LDAPIVVGIVCIAFAMLGYWYVERRIK